jgi:hypothetical protein
MSPLFFDFVIDTLCQMLHRCKEKGVIQGLGPTLSDGHKFLYFLYANDIIFFFLQADDKSVEVMMWALFAFEALTNIKVYFSKTKMILMNLDNLEASKLVNIIGCRLSTFPLQYLGVSLSDTKLKLSN